MNSVQWDWLRRAIRSFVQGFLGMLILVGFPVAQNIINAVTNGEPFSIDLEAWKRILIAALFAGGMALVSLLMNLLEDKTTMPAMLKDKPSTGQNPAPDAPPAGGNV